MLRQTDSEYEAREFVNDCKENYGLVCFYPSWSGPSRLSRKAVEKLSQTYPSLPILVVDPIDCLDFASESGVEVYPTLVIYARGRPLDWASTTSEEIAEQLFKKYAGEIPPQKLGANLRVIGRRRPEVG